MNSYPIKTMSLQEAIEYQFHLVDTIARHFNGLNFLNMGDLGVVKSLHTQKVEETLADFFGAEEAVLARGAGSGAIRWGLYAVVKAGGTLLVHNAPLYPTTETSIEMMGLKLKFCDFNTSENFPDADAVLVQYARQKIDDSYDMPLLLQTLKENYSSMPVLCDDNYLVMKSPRISAGMGADLSAFSLFKLLGPLGIGCLVGKKSFIQKIKKVQYSGGSQVQGYEAMEALRALVYTPVALALQSDVVDACAEKLNQGLFSFVKGASIANAQSKVLLVEFHEDIAEELLIAAEKLGALPHPVGAESRYEILPLFYRLSGTFLKAYPSLKKNMVRINPNRSGVDTVLRILESAYNSIKK